MMDGLSWSEELIDAIVAFTTTTTAIESKDDAPNLDMILLIITIVVVFDRI